MSEPTDTPETPDSPESADNSADYSPEELDAKPQAGTNGNADVNLDLVLDIPVDVSLRVGSTEICIRDLVSLVEGSVVALDQEAGEPMDVLVNGTLIAHGEIVVVDEKFGVRLTDVISATERIENLNGAGAANG
ncbi:MAG: flagellar motor switch protein FliN [Pseudomonadota bacterium]